MQTLSDDPLHPLNWTKRADGVPELTTDNTGLTKREYFAVQLQAALIQHYGSTHANGDWHSHEAVKAADELINALNS